MTDETTAEPPREPEIEFLGKLAHGFLAFARVALWGAGTAAIGYGIWQTFLAGSDPALAGETDPALSPTASHLVWFPLGLPLVLPADWLLTKNRHRIWILAVSVMLWFTPMLFGDASRYGYILRMFATLISFLSLLVWRTLWQLTKPAEATN